MQAKSIISRDKFSVCTSTSCLSLQAVTTQRLATTGRGIWFLIPLNLNNQLFFLCQEGCQWTSQSHPDIRDSEAGYSLNNLFNATTATKWEFKACTKCKALKKISTENTSLKTSLVCFFFIMKSYLVCFQWQSPKKDVQIGLNRSSSTNTYLLPQRLSGRQTGARGNKPTVAQLPLV